MLEPATGKDADLTKPVDSDVKKRESDRASAQDAVSKSTALREKKAVAQPRFLAISR